MFNRFPGAHEGSAAGASLAPHERRGRRGGDGPGSVHGVTDARVVAAQVLADLRAGDLLDPAFESRAAPLDPRDRRWTQELLWGMLRRRGWLDAVLAERVRGGLARLDPDLGDLLRLGVYQLLYMGSVPAYAAIAQTVELAKRRHGIGASKLANAVLRRVDRDAADLQVPDPLDPIDALATRHSHPRWLVQRWVERFGMEEAEQLLLSNNREATVYARPWDTSTARLAESLEEAGVHTAPAPFLEDGLALGGMAALTQLGAFRQGQFFVQDPAATLVTRYASIPAGSMVADLCAAPGGKTLEISRDARWVLAADKSEGRLRRLAANLERLHVGNVQLLCADARRPVVMGVDAVLLDVPCTGTGTFRRHPDARWRLRASDLAVLGTLQRELMAAAAQVVRPGGLLIYSTCSLEPEENDVQVQRFLSANPEWQLEPPSEGVVPPETLDDGVLRMLPQRHDVDGAFAARLRRSS